MSPSTTTLLDEISNNKIETLHLTEDPEEYFTNPKEFAAAMEQNTSIKKVFFEKDFIACLKGNERAIVVSAVGNLPNVETVQLKDSLLMVGICVTNLVKNAKKLSSLSMENCVLQGVPEDFTKLHDAIKENSSVKSLKIGDDCTPTYKVDLKELCSDLKINVSVPSAA